VSARRGATSWPEQSRGSSRTGASSTIRASPPRSPASSSPERQRRYCHGSVSRTGRSPTTVNRTIGSTPHRADSSIQAERVSNSKSPGPDTTSANRGRVSTYAAAFPIAAIELVSTAGPRTRNEKRNGSASRLPSDAVKSFEIVTV
jgi:hypothetical protein